MNDEDKFAYYLMGLIDGEGCFYIQKSPSKNMKCRIRLAPSLKIAVNIDRNSIDLFLKIKDFLGIGAVHPHKNGSNKYLIEYQIGYISGAKKICDIFDKYPDGFKIKFESYKIWREITYSMVNKEHLTEKGFQKILELSKKINIRGNIPARQKEMSDALYDWYP